MSNVAHGRVLVIQKGAESYSGHSSWSVVVVSRSSWMVFIFYGGYAHVFTETYGWENRGQCLDKCTGGQNTCRWARKSTETEAECRLLLSYLLLLFFLLVNVY